MILLLTVLLREAILSRKTILLRKAILELTLSSVALTFLLAIGDFVFCC